MPIPATMSILQASVKVLAVIAICGILTAQCSPVLQPPFRNGFYAKTSTNDNGQQQQKRIFDIILEANAMVTSRPGSPGHTIRNEELFQGDIVMTNELRRAIREGGTDAITLPPRGRISRSKRAVISNTRSKWPTVNAVVKVPFVIESSSVPDRLVIIQAMRHWEVKVPCINFVPKTSQKDYISFFAGQGCYSWTGRTGGKQRISIGKGCAVRMGVVAHEIGHALGFWHEQSRQDRDKYVKILWNNIQTGSVNDFKKIIDTRSNDLGVPYDLKSIMHYGPTAFAKATGLNTIEKLDGTTDFGQASGLSDKDVQQAKLLYCQGLNSKCKYKDDSSVIKHCPTWRSYGFCNNKSIYQPYMITYCKRTCLCKV